MSILKMKFINIVGPKDQFDDFVSNHIVNSGIQLEYALGLLGGIKGLSPCNGDNSHSLLVKRCSSLLESMGIDGQSFANVDKNKEAIPSNKIINQLDQLENNFQNLLAEKINIEQQLEESLSVRKQLGVLPDIDVDLNSFLNFEFIKFRFGKMPKKSFDHLQLYLDELECILIPTSSDRETIWVTYFTPEIYQEKVDGILSSLYFERTIIPRGVEGTPSEALALLEEKISSLEQNLKDAEKTINTFINDNIEKVVGILNLFQNVNAISEIKKYAAQTKDSFYILGWIPKKELKQLAPVFNKYKDISFIIEEPDMVKHTKPPTELKNHRIFRPFETLVRMYGLPAYNEIDPTTFVAITYFLMFGFMFGDIGQGLILFLLGFVLMKRKIQLGGVIMGAGTSAVFFGFLYGSIFGFEDWIPHIWMAPMENINQFLIYGVAVGLILISLSMILNIVNGIKSKNIVRVLFDRNGLIGFIFYWLIIFFVLYFLNTGKMFISIGFIALCLLLPLVAMFLKEPLENMLNKKAFWPKNKGGFFVETFFELFETVMSFASNTISFIRLSAFALNHAGLFMAVLMLSRMTKGVGSIMTVIIGNIIIIALEGLIVGIQALRLEYYELFGRFFTGGGKSYHPLKNKNILYK